MLFKRLITAALAAVASAQSLTDALSSQNASLSSLIGLLQTQPALVQTLGTLSNVTLLAPNNAAIAKFLNSSAAAAAAASPDVIAAILTYHVLNGTFPASAFTTTPQFIPSFLTNTSYTNVTGGQRVEVFVNGSSVDIISGGLAESTVVTPNIKFNGGIIHIIDTVLTIPLSDSTTAVAAGLTSLASALTSANLVSTVNGLKDVTIFAPTNAAFSAISSTLANISTSTLTSVLTYHVVAGTVGYSTLLKNETLTTVNGGNVTITVANGNVFVNSAKVVIPNVLVANGVVHVIDSVLNPNNTAVNINPTATSSATGSSSGASSTKAPSGSATSAASSNPGATASQAGAAQAIQTGAIGMGALFGGAALLLGNL